MMLIRIKQHLSNIWSSVQEDWGWIEKKNVAYENSVYMNKHTDTYIYITNI